jgi:predicted dehydrogenase|tara:strand:+ start:340 stop:1149 length:810 start_codon:yes stop_codon:yes gene_type:complete
MKSIIIGGGSIGKRHSKNLNNLGVSTIIVDIDRINDIDNILQEGFDLGLVCTPNINHIEHCIKLAQHNIPIFCEKPFYSNLEGVEDLLSLVKEKNLITMVGCNLRFTPEIQKINPHSKYISVYFGYDLKKWRPQTNHLKSYSANKNLGGGVLLDVIHELDYLYHKFGSIKKITYTKNKLTDITMDTEDLVVGRIEFKKGNIADFTLNYLSEEYQRYYDVLDKGLLKRVNLCLDNQMYIDEISYFLNCIKSNTQGMNSFKEAHQLLKHLI